MLILRFQPVFLFVLSAAFFCAGCSSPRPVLYPNPYLQQVGKEQAEKDIDSAMQMAESYNLKPYGASENIQKTATNTAVKSGSSAASGAIGGNPGISAASSAAGSATGGMLSWLFTSEKPNQTYRKFVETTLKQKGYQVIGWE